MKKVILEGTLKANAAIINLEIQKCTIHYTCKKVPCLVIGNRLRVINL
ncbi:hypothetical protein P4283_18995 [Bacillus thuringiensis]|nr:hypothetical protein [Bacillus thuringiensis]